MSWMTDNVLTRTAGWLFYIAILGALAVSLPREFIVPGGAHFILLIGGIGIWRYSMGIIHFARGMYFLHVAFPRIRARAMKLDDDGAPSHVYLMVTSFRIDAHTTAKVYESIIREAIECGWATTVVASIVELSDEMLMRALWRRLNPPERVKLRLVRIPGTGKRDGLAYGFRAISRDVPDDHAVVAVVDGDTVLNPGVVRGTAPYFRLMPNVGALTTNEFCEVHGSYLMSEWHKLRFAQRHLNMCSMALSRRVLTLTGRMSVFRASVVTRSEFIGDVEYDSLKHWRLGRFRFLTGDDKSSWFSMMRLGYDTFYVPDASIHTVEHPPDPSFIRSARQLMFRWYGNSLRQNSRATKLGPRRLGWFTWYVLWDQRVSMWTSILGLTAALVAAIKYSGVILVAYLLWIGLTRLVLSALLLATGHPVGPAYPVILYFNQIFGSLMKIYVFFRLDRQSWTRQKTSFSTDSASFQQRLNRWSSRVMTFSAVSMFLATVMFIV
ncbi:glycosyltransferase family 2 protein [Marinobacter hydrocarbonoclasticus]|uniref:glycosyltransferase family 2 protein n=1 Tax=Marinobacter nauticus TaxID=2743 RepID=UPI001A8D0F38|nr:glycosyltransferase family 2 protein [Marinobacter nauticus]MBN8240676.1 glycosyltransferase family 2 protein [Marinobacter nauticus]